MESARALRVSLLFVALVALAPATARAAQTPALPDLEQVAPFDVRVVPRHGRWYLGFSTAVKNVGPASLRIRGTGTGNRQMAADQLSEDGLTVLKPGVGTLRFITAHGHHHWHFMGFMHYELLGMDIPGVLRDHKQGFCLSEAPFVNGWCAPDQPDLTTIDEGIAPGGVDIYKANVEGQEIEIDRHTVPGGRYVITSRIGPTGLIQETRTDNNAASTIIELHWPFKPYQRIEPLGECLGEGCAGTLPLPAEPPALKAADARRFARTALRKVFGRNRTHERVRGCAQVAVGGRQCRASFTRARQHYSGTVRVWYQVDGAALRWYYSVTMVGRTAGCKTTSRCTHRVSRSAELGGRVAR
jgi:hypothetical protein